MTFAGPLAIVVRQERHLSPQAYSQFDHWHEADALAYEAECIVKQSYRMYAAGRGPPPSEMQLAVTRELKRTARLRLDDALRQFDQQAGTPPI